MNNESKALQAIKESAGTEYAEYGIDLFVSHHLQELPKSYWRKHIGTDYPGSQDVVDILVLKSKWKNEEVYDFTLPESVTNYVISVSFGSSGEVESIGMEG